MATQLRHCELGDRRWCGRHFGRRSGWLLKVVVVLGSSSGDRRRTCDDGIGGDDGGRRKCNNGISVNIAKAEGREHNNQLNETQQQGATRRDVTTTKDKK